MDNTLLRLINALCCLPGVGPKSAQRMAFYLLNNQRERGINLATCLQAAMQTLGHCRQCNNHTSLDLCHLCTSTSRDQRTLCVVESPSDINAIEQSQAYQGRYFVLMGKISPMDGIGPDQIKLPKLESIILSENIQEVILALSPSIEGQTTNYFICERLRDKPVRITQLAHGIPSSGELEYLDGHTIGHALRNRINL
jgi:recombination protein RecR